MKILFNKKFTCDNWKFSSEVLVKGVSLNSANIVSSNTKKLLHAVFKSNAFDCNSQIVSFSSPVGALGMMFNNSSRIFGIHGPNIVRAFLFNCLFSSTVSFTLFHTFKKSKYLT